MFHISLQGFLILFRNQLVPLQAFEMSNVDMLVKKNSFLQKRHLRLLLYLRFIF